MKLTPHFTLAELTASTKARQLGIDNTPTPQALAELQRTAEMLERIRTTLGAPIIISSGYRSPEVNRAARGVASSDHTKGMAADFTAPGYGTPYEVAKALAPLISVLGIGQVIHEFGQWVHVSTQVPSKPANRVITISNVGIEMGVQEVA